jgi:hypothetical protein
MMHIVSRHLCSFSTVINASYGSVFTQHIFEHLAAWLCATVSSLLLLNIFCSESTKTATWKVLLELEITWLTHPLYHWLGVSINKRKETLLHICISYLKKCFLNIHQLKH